MFRIDPNTNKQRFYRLDVQQDLFGRWILTREWGRIGHRGQMQSASFDNHPDAQNALRSLQNQKNRRGYVNILSAVQSSYDFPD